MQLLNSDVVAYIAQDQHAYIEFKEEIERKMINTYLSGNLGTNPRSAPFSNGILKHTFLRLSQHQPLQHPCTLH